MRDQIIEMFKSSIIVQSLVTLMVIGTILVMFLAPVFNSDLIVDGKSIVQVPESLYVIAGTVLGYWFKTKDKFNSDQAAAQMASQIALILKRYDEVQKQDQPSCHD